MKLDLPVILKLTPPGLYELADLRAFVVSLIGVVKLGIGSVRDTKSYASMLARHTKELRTKTRINLNLKIKAWVLGCPERIAEVRSAIGEATIRRWIIRMRAAYMAPGLAREGWVELGIKLKCKYRNTHRLHRRKPFALARLADVEKLLPFRPRWPRNIRQAVSDETRGETGNVRRAARLTHSENSGNPAKPRPQPVRFFPSEIGVKIRDPEPKGQIGERKYGGEPPLKPPKKPDRANQKGPDKPSSHPDYPRRKKPP